MANAEDVKTALKTQGAPKPVPSSLKGIVNMEGIKKKFEDMLGAKKAAGFLSSIVSAYETNAALRSCDPMNIMSQAAVAASLDLPINPSLGFAHLVPYDGKAQFQMGWRGYVQLAQRTGEYRDINVSEVYEDEIDYYNPITGEFKTKDPKTWKLRYAEYAGDKARMEKIAGFVGYFELLNGFKKYLYMTKNQCMVHGKKYSKSFQKGKGKWADDPFVMCLKTVIKMLLSKWAPLSIEMMRAVRLDQAVVHDDDTAEYVDLPDPAAPEGSDETPKTEEATVVTPEATPAPAEAAGPVSMKDGKPITF